MLSVVISAIVDHSVRPGSGSGSSDTSNAAPPSSASPATVIIDSWLIRNFGNAGCYMAMQILQISSPSCGSSVVVAQCSITLAPFCGVPPPPTIVNNECKSRRISGPTRLSSKVAVRRRRRTIPGPGFPPWNGDAIWQGFPGGGAGDGGGLHGGFGGFGGGGGRGESADDDEYYGQPWTFWLWHLFCVLNLANTLLFAARNSLRTCALV